MDAGERKSDAIEPGRLVGVGTSSTPVLDADDPDPAAKFYIGNFSDTAITLRYAAEGAVAGAGIVLQPNSILEEDRYAGAVCAIHAGAGTKYLSLVIV